MSGNGKTLKKDVDAYVENHFSFFLVRPVSGLGRDWLDEKTDGTWFGGALAVEHRYIEDLVAGMRGDGLVVA